MAKDAEGPATHDLADTTSAGIMDSLYAEHRRWHDHCKKANGDVDHRTTREHECYERFRPHTCKPLAPSTIRQIQFVLHVAVHW